MSKSPKESSEPSQSQHRFGRVTEAFFGVAKKVKFYRLLGWRDGHGMKVTDIGCGRGDFLDFAQKRGWNTMGFEFDAETARQAARNSQLNIMLAEELPKQMASQAGSIDLITMLHVLEHLDDPDEALRACRSGLSYRGTLIIEVPNPLSIAARISPSTWLGWDPPNHRFHFSCKALCRALADAGFRPVVVKGGSVVYELGFAADAYNDRILRKTQALFSLLKGGDKYPPVRQWIPVIAILPLTLPLAVCTVLVERLARQSGTIRVIAKPK